MTGDGTKFPIQLSVQCIFPENKKEFLTCTSLLRIIPHNRAVYEAFWNDRAVIAKVFSHKIKARYHLRREWKGLSILQKRHLTTTAPLFYGRTEDGRWAVVVKKIDEAVTAQNAFDNMADKSEKLYLLKRVCKEIAEQHEKGVLQKDLHLGNFLLTGERVFTLDPGKMHFYSHSVSRVKCISQLARLACYLPEEDDTSIEELWDTYFRVRGWQLERADKILLQKKHALYRAKAFREFLKKRLRTNKRFLRIKTSKYHSVFDRDFCSGAEPIDFMDRIDTLMTGGNILKNGNTCFVSRMRWNNQEVVIKRYNHKGVVHSLRHTIKGSRACRAWLHGHRLMYLDIATPKPLAYMEKRFGPFIYNAYLVTEYIGAPRLNDFLRDVSITEDHRVEAIQQVKGVLNRLAEYGISHGDLKHSNILLAAGGAVLTDLDSMKISKWKWLYHRRRHRDIKRFHKQ